MLKVQEYVKSHGLDKLKEVYGINYKLDNESKRVILDYDQIESHKFKDNAIVRECRGLVLENNTFNLIARSFERFFNYPEVDVIDWSQPVECTTKEDGSLINVYYYDDKWNVNTRFSFGDLPVNNSEYTWRQLVEAHLDFNKLFTTSNYIFELVGPYNKVVVDYEPSLILLSVFEGENEFARHYTRKFAKYSELSHVKSFDISSEGELFSLLDNLNKTDVDSEGFVIRDCNNVRSKVKHDKYLVAHRLSNNGNIASPKNLVPLIMTNETDELLSFKCFQYVKPEIEKYQAKIDAAWKEIDNCWFVHCDEENQKKFALAIMKDTKYTAPLFNAKKTGKSPREFFTTEYVLKNVFGV